MPQRSDGHPSALLSPGSALRRSIDPACPARFGPRNVFTGAGTVRSGSAGAPASASRIGRPAPAAPAPARPATRRAAGVRAARRHRAYLRDVPPRARHPGHPGDPGTAQGPPRIREPCQRPSGYSRTMIVLSANGCTDVPHSRFPLTRSPGSAARRSCWCGATTAATPAFHARAPSRVAGSSGTGEQQRSARDGHLR